MGTIRKKINISLFTLLVLCISSLSAATIVSRQTGTWTTASTWIYYCTGTASFTNGSTTVTGSGTAFTTELSNGSILMLQTSSGTVRGTVSSITNNTTLILTSAASATVSGLYGKQSAPTDGSSEDIIIDGGFTVTTDFGSDFDILSLTINDGNTLTHNANKKLNISTFLTLDGTLNGTSTKTVELNISDASGVLLSGDGTYSASKNLTLNGDMTIPAGSIITLSGAGKLDISGNILTNDGRINILEPSSFVASGTFINNTSSSYLYYTKQADFPNITLTATATGNTVEFAWSTGSYQIENTASYYNIVLSGGGTKETDNNNMKIYGDLTIGNGVNFNSGTGSDNITIYGNWDNDNGGSFTGTTTKTTSFAGTANNQTIYTPAGGETFGNITINNTYGSVTAAGNIYVANGGTVTLTAGTFNMSTYSLDETSGSANFTQTGGDFQLAKLSTVLPQLGGTYTISGGTITLNGAGAQTFRGETVSSPIVANYNNLTLAGSGVKTVEGNIDINGDLTIGGSAQLDISSTNNSSNIRNITIAGNWINSSSNADPFLERTGTVAFDGANDIALTASPVSGGETFYNLTINKTASTDDLTLNNAATVSNSLTLTSGHIVSSTSAYFIMGSSSSLGTTPTDNSHVSGPMQKTTASTSAFVFPIGKNGSYRWMEITPTSSSSTTFTAEYFYASPSNNSSLGSGVDHISDAEYWNLSRSGSANAAVKLSWNTLSAVTTNTSDLMVVQWDGSSSWVNRCGGGCTVTGGSTTSSGSISASGITTFGNSFTLGSPNTNNDLGTTRYSVASGNWSSTSTWAKRSGGTAGASAPGANNKVVIENGYRVDVDATIDCLKLTVGGTTAGTLDFNATANDVNGGSEGIVIYANGDVEGTNSGAELRTTGSIVLNADISTESSGGATSSFVLRRRTTASQTISGIGTVANFDNDATTTNNGTLTITTILQGGSVLTNADTLIYKGTAGNFDGGAFSASTSGNLVEFNNTIAGFDMDMESTYHHLTISGNSSKDFNGTTTTINGNLTIGNSATLNLETNDEDLVIKGNFVNNGTFTASTSSSKEVTFSGSSAQQITSNGSCFYRLYIANTSSTGVTFQDAACIASGGKIDLSDGYLYLGNNDLTLNGTGTSPSSATSASFIVTNGTGTMKATCGNITYPLGTTGSTSAYTPLTINNSGTSDSYAVRICDYATTDGTCGGTAITSGVVNKTWQITETTAGGSNVALTLQWNAANEGGSFTRTSGMISHYTGGQWEAEQTETAASGSGPYTLSVSGLTSFSPYAVMSSAAPLPVELISFSAKLNNDFNVDIKWATASEINNDYFVVERSKDASYFEPVANIQGAGNSNQILHYHSADEAPLPGISFYRLKQVDFDGTVSYSSVVMVNSNAAENKTVNSFGFTLYPNPTNSIAHLSFFNIDTQGEVIINVYDLQGKIVHSSTQQIYGEGSIVSFDASTFDSGIYIVNTTIGGVVQHQKLVVTSSQY